MFQTERCKLILIAYIRNGDCCYEMLRIMIILGVAKDCKLNMQRATLRHHNCYVFIRCVTSPLQVS